MLVVGLDRGIYDKLVGAAMLAFSLVMIVKTTKNYFVKAPPVESRDS